MTVTGGTIHFTFSDFSHTWLLPSLPAHFNPLTCIEILSRVLNDSNDIMVGQESLLFDGEKLSVTDGTDFRQIFGTWTFIWLGVRSGPISKILFHVVQERTPVCLMKWSRDHGLTCGLK